MELADILQARERRVSRQREMLSEYGCPLVSFTMNIAGPVKRSPLIEDGFFMGCRLLEGQLLRAKAPILHKEVIIEDTGCEALYAVQIAASALKALTTELEDCTPAGRLFDMDVIGADGKKLDRATERSCLICGRPGAGCARSRAHTVSELQTKTTELLEAAVSSYHAETAASLACRALLYEVSVTPKPGLVDRANSGSHRDMDIYTFFDSISVLHPYFAECVDVGRESREETPAETLEQLRIHGKLAEDTMLLATGGVNTHKGAIFTLGILCGALGRLPRPLWCKPARVLQEAAAMCRGLGKELEALTHETAVTAGQKLYLLCGITGIRGQLQAGLPTVLSHGLPALENALTAGKSKDEAGCRALLSLLSVTPDTNLIHRGGLEAAEAAAKTAAELLQNGYHTEDLTAMDAAFQKDNLSPGGCADLLSVCWLLHFLKEE